MTRATSVTAAVAAPSRSAPGAGIAALSPSAIAVLAAHGVRHFVSRRFGRGGTRAAAEGGTNGHADAGRVALAEHVARHDLAGGEQVRARRTAEVNGAA